MKISRKGWFLFLVLSVLALGAWYKLTYPQLSCIELSVNKDKALSVAKDYLASLGVDVKQYRNSIVFVSSDWTDRFLQKTLGTTQEEIYMRAHGLEMFRWRARFFKELEKEEFSVEVSPKSSEVVQFSHTIEDTAPEKFVDKDDALKEARVFLSKNFSLDFSKYDFHEEKVKKYDNRVDYSFSWEKKDSSVPWGDAGGQAKLLAGATVSGKNIYSFYKGKLNIPEQFKRYINKQLVFGEYLSTVTFILYMLLFLCAVCVVLNKKHTFALMQSKKFFMGMAAFFVALHAAGILNQTQGVWAGYNTSVSVSSYLGIFYLRAIVQIVFLSFFVILPGIAGEAIRVETFSGRKDMSFLHYIRSSFLTRNVSALILLGYCVCFILLGIQAVLFGMGQKYLGVWKEWMRFTQMSSTTVPLIAAFITGVSASLNEEILFRLFGITWLKKYLKSTVLAVIVTSFIWGFGHTQYAVFPVWFRALEVGVMGLFYGFIFVRFGLIPLLVAHYLFDVFWDITPHLFGHSTVSLTLGSIFLLVLPLIFAAVSYLSNKSEEERNIDIALSKIQKYNLDILKVYLARKKSEGMSVNAIKEELIAHNWDSVLIDLAIKEVFNL